jgi:hypothetical protein
MNLRRRLVLLVSLALAWAGCSGDETHYVCLTDCDHSAIFNLTTPISGRQFSISIGEMDGNVVHLDCQPGDGSVSCIPVSSRLVATFDAAGALTSLKLATPPNGTLAVQIVVDGAPAAAGSFPYQPPVTGGTDVADPCGGGPTVPRCVGSETFTIGN